jgi:predicted RND superfamily exporter protein
MKRSLTAFSVDHPWWVIGIAVLITVFFGLQFPKIQIDTDPENMLPADEPIRVFYQQVKDDFTIYDFIAVGVVNPEGAFTADQLNRIYRITEEIENIDGVIVEDIMAPSTVDDILQKSGGILAIQPLMPDEIETQQEAEHILSRIKDNPVLRGKLASDDGKAIAIFIPIESKDISYRVAGEIRDITDRLGGDATYHIAGLPVAQDSFGAEMFTQMAISAPAAMLIIFLLLLLFFRKAKVILAPMVVAMMSVIWAMGLLILTGHTVHIMSSMIPIFLVPIAVLNSIHLISEVHDRYKEIGNKKETFRHAVHELFLPMLFTSATTVAGFISLALTPIPPVQVFGIFVAFGIMVSWFLSLVINPAIGSLISEKTLANFGEADSSTGPLAATMNAFRNLAKRHNRLILTGAVIIMVIAGIGLTMIEVNDNPVKWFKKSHPIRKADVAMNDHLAGTYMNYLVFSSEDEDHMKSPEVERYIEAVQRDLEQDPIVGATTGLPDIIKKVRYELFGADSAKLALPDNQDEIAQMLFLFEISGGDPDDLFKFVTQDYTSVNLWVQMRDGDNQAVSRVVERANRYFENNPPPAGITVEWSGLPYINIHWQEKMVTGMSKSLMSAFAVVLIMMIALFRSLKWGIISVLPLTITIMTIYAIIGYIGKPYDMPIAVLSSLTLGLSVDFAIHFIQRKRTLFKRTGSYEEAYHNIFEGAGRAISRNVLVIAIGFVPMLFSNLVPYITVGTFFLAIMGVSGLVTMLLLPAISRTFARGLFKVSAKPHTK